MVKKATVKKESKPRGLSVTLVNGKRKLRISNGQTRTGAMFTRATLTEGDGKTKRKSQQYAANAAMQTTTFDDWVRAAETKGFARRGASFVPFDDLLG